MFKQLAKDNKNIKFIHIDIDEAGETMPNELSSINSVPTFKFYFDGKQIDTFSGANLTRIRDNVDKLKQMAKKPEDGGAAKGSDDDKDKEKEEEEKKDDTNVNKVVHVSKKEDFAKHLSLGKTVVDFSASWYANN